MHAGEDRERRRSIGNAKKVAGSRQQMLSGWVKQRPLGREVCSIPQYSSALARSGLLRTRMTCLVCDCRLEHMHSETTSIAVSASLRIGKVCVH